MKKTAVVILNYNGAKMLEKYLPIVLAHTSNDAEVVVADNASTDNSLALMQSQFPDVRTIVLDRNYGFADGYNKALSQVEAEYYVLLNSDVETTEGWLKPLVAFMEGNADVAACQPKLLSVIDKNQFEYAGAAGGFVDCLGYPFCRGRIFDTIEEDHGQYDDNIEIHWATGACMMVRSKDYWQAGGLDGRFFAHNEEIDLCWRLRIMGKRIFCVSESKVYHLGGGTLPKSNPMKTYLNFRNNLTMIYKNMEDGKLRLVMTARFFLDYLAAVQMTVKSRSLADFKAIWKARRDFKAWKKEYTSIRKHIQEMRLSQEGSKKDMVNENATYSILWKYHIMGIKVFAELCNE